MKTTTSAARPVTRRPVSDPAVAEGMARGLAGLLADTYSLYLTTQGFHWNVEGENFPQYHALFQEQYQQLAAAVDVLAEAVRALGCYAPASFDEFQRRSALKQPAGAAGGLSAPEMVRHLADAHGRVLGRIGELLPESEQPGLDWVNDLLIERQAEHSKSRWMLRATAGGPSEPLD